jgi:hypothetical protein
MAKVKPIQSVQITKVSVNKKASRSKIGKLPDARADVPFDDDVAGK